MAEARPLGQARKHSQVQTPFRIQLRPNSIKPLLRHFISSPLHRRPPPGPRLEPRLRLFEQGDDVFLRRRSLFFKKMQIVRGCDAKRNVLVYMVYSDRLIEGSPKNSITAVPVDRATPIPLK